MPGRGPRSASGTDCSPRKSRKLRKVTRLARAQFVLATRYTKRYRTDPESRPCAHRAAVVWGGLSRPRLQLSSRVRTRHLRRRRTSCRLKELAATDHAPRPFRSPTCRLALKRNERRHPAPYAPEVPRRQMLASESQSSLARRLVAAMALDEAVPAE